MIKDIPNILNSIAAVSSMNEKKKILEKTKDDTLRYIFKMTYDPFITYGIYKIDTSDLWYDDNKIVDDSWLANLNDLLYKLENRELTGNAAREKIKHFLNISPKSWADIVLKILKKDLRIGVSGKTINKVYKNLFPEQTCMNAMKYDEKRVSYPVYVDTKLDGIRCIADMSKKKLFSRNGKEFVNYPTIMKELEQLAELTTLKIDGEIIMGDFQNLMRTVSRKDDGIELAKDAVYNIFDLIIENIPFKERQLIIQNEIKNSIQLKNLKHLTIVHGDQINNEEELITFYNDQLVKGYEGIMIKSFDGYYEFKRSYSWQKMKPEETIDLPIVEVQEGTGKYKNQLGAFICLFANGKHVRVGSGFKDDEREKFWKEKQSLLGQIIEIKFQEKTNDGSLRFPVFIRFRNDK